MLSRDFIKIDGFKEFAACSMKLSLLNYLQKISRPIRSTDFVIKNLNLLYLQFAF